MPSSESSPCTCSPPMMTPFAFRCLLVLTLSGSIVACSRAKESSEPATSPHEESEPTSEEPEASEPLEEPINDDPSNVEKPSATDNEEAAGAESEPSDQSEEPGDDGDDPEFPSGSFGISQDSGELDMILGLRDIPPFRIADLLTADDLRATIGLRSPSTLRPLPGKEPSPYYNSLWYAPEDGETLGVVFQYWHFKNVQSASTHYQSLERSAPSATKPVGVASQSFYTEFEGVTRLVSLDFDQFAVIAISCEIEGCHVPQLMQWMRTAIQRVNE